MLWSCPNCGFQVPMEAHEFPVRCICGGRYNADGTVYDGHSPALVNNTPGVGDHLHHIITELGIKPDASCGCEAMRQKMNAWGPAGCREHMPEIIAHLEAAYQSTNWLTILRAAPLAAAQGIVSIRGLVDESIRRAELAR